MKLITALAALAALALAPSTAAAGPPQYFGHPKGDLSAPTQLHVTSGCVDRDTFILPLHHIDGVTQAFIEVTEYDHCVDQVLLDHVGFMDAPTVSIAADLTSASMSGTFPMYDALDDAFPQIGTLALDLTWAGAGRLYSDNILYDNGHNDGITLINHDHEQCRDATVSGTLDGTSVDDVVASRLCRQLGGSLFLFRE